MLGALQRLTENDLSGDVGHAGDGGHDTHVARLSDGSGFSAMPDGAELLLSPAGWPVTSHPCDPGMKRDLMLSTVSIAHGAWTQSTEKDRFN